MLLFGILVTNEDDWGRIYLAAAEFSFPVLKLHFSFSLASSLQTRTIGVELKNIVAQLLKPHWYKKPNLKVLLIPDVDIFVFLNI